LIETGLTTGKQGWPFIGLSQQITLQYYLYTVV